MADSTVDRDQMRLAAQRIDEASNNILGIEQRVDQHLIEVRGAWDSGAATAFENVVNKWSGEMRTLQQQLTDMHDKLVSTHAVYTQREQDVHDSVNQVANLINE